MARLVERNVLVHERNAFLPESEKRRLDSPSSPLSTFSDKKHRTAKSREAVVQAFLMLEKKGRINRTDASIVAALAEIKIEAAKFYSQPSAFDEHPIIRGAQIIPMNVSARSVRRWVKAYEELGLAGLYDAIENRGNRQRRLGPDELVLMSQVVSRYLDERKPSISKIYNDVRASFEAENLLRRERGARELVPPSRETVRLAIRELDPFRCDLAREGVARCRRSK
ncbi:helix-turn-helix domain-containing protein [Paracoccus sp. S-4012]|uniref:helix-turn-helix domain-containing protein n=1 Tax=Paracoccus sp. S-4012 TaxID=2665648 RepID=UPI0018A23A9C|nr:helix-turn-helix domain-containing protein [Paracoccus sp. S-4012]